MEALADNADDKMQLIKLQNDLNFLKKKSEESTEAIIAKERELEEAKLTLKEMTEQQNLRNDAGQKFMEEANMQQIKDTIAAYEARVADLVAALAERTAEVERQKMEL